MCFSYRKTPFCGLIFHFFHVYMKTSSNPSLKKKVSRYISSIKTEVAFFFFVCLFMKRNTERAQCALSLVCIPKEKKGSEKIKQVYKISKKCNKEKSCHLVPKMVIEGSRKYRGRERVPKVGSRREETITEPINSRIGEFHTIIVGKCCLTCGTWPSHWRWNTGSQFIRAVTKVIAVEER